MVGSANAPRTQVRRLIQHAFPQPGYGSTHEGPGTWRSSPRDQYWSLIHLKPETRDCWLVFAWWILKEVLGVQGLSERIWGVGTLDTWAQEIGQNRPSLVQKALTGLPRPPARKQAWLEFFWCCYKTAFRSGTLIGIGLGGLAAWDGVRWVNILDGQLRSGQSSMSHSTTISASALHHSKTLHPKPQILNLPCSGDF